VSAPRYSVARSWGARWWVMDDLAREGVIWYPRRKEAERRAAELNAGLNEHEHERGHAQRPGREA
jgi:hypothetical protein